jgi:hypothetical protein
MKFGIEQENTKYQFMIALTFEVQLLFIIVQKKENYKKLASLYVVVEPLKVAM